jgi:glycosyltransferase involved in cell wall biosynthesis
MNELKFSVAMSVYKSDNAVHFDRALYSITTGQTRQPDEIVLIVDGPIGDDLNQVIAKYESGFPTLRVIRLAQNGGLGNALKLAVENASYDLIARMDSDDISVPVRFEQQLQCFAEQEDLDIVGGNISEFIGEENNIVAYRKVPKTNEEIYAYMQKRSPLNHVSVMYKKSAVLAAGNYMDLFWNEDYYLWIRMAENHCVMANTGTVLVNVRTGADMYKRRGGKRYFQSEKFLQKYMLQRKMISRSTYISNTTKRWILQCLLPNNVRGWAFRTFARSKRDE